MGQGVTTIETPATGAPTTTRTTTRTKVAPAAQTPWEKVMQQAPSLDVPAQAAKRESSYLKTLETIFKAKYEAVRLVWVAVPGCDPAAEEVSLNR